MLTFIQNTGDYFASNFFTDDFDKKTLAKSGWAKEDLQALIARIRKLKDPYYQYKQSLLEGRWRTKDKITETHRFHTKLLKALGYPAEHPEYEAMFHLDETTVLPVRHTLRRGDQVQMMVMEMQTLLKEGDEEPDGLFEQRYHNEEEQGKNADPTLIAPQKYHRSQWANVFTVPEGLKISPMIIHKAVSELFLLEQHHRPKYLLLCAGNTCFLLEQEKWFRGSYLQFDLETLFEEATVNKNLYALFYALLSKETLAPQAERSLLEALDEDSHKSAYEVTKDLKEGVIHAVEAIANEAVYDWQQQGKDLNSLQAQLLKDDCLTMVYRLLFLFYAESREDLALLPVKDPVYQQGYSLEMLRDLELVPLHTASSQEGYFFHESLQGLFKLLHQGRKTTGKHSFQMRPLDSPLFDDKTLHYLPKVRLRNRIWQEVICQLSLSNKKKGKARGRISYANLGINQLGSVYESLLAFRGFFTETEYIEVHRKAKSRETSAQVIDKDGSFLVPRHRIDDFDQAEVHHHENGDLHVIPANTFIYRLSGRDRQQSASYYTPEVLTQCTVKYTLKPLLEKVEKGEMQARDLLDLKILEPAMGAAAFHNEVLDQLAEAYLGYRQEELKQKVAPDKYQEERQQVKAYLALNNVYGVDLNPTAVELGKLSLWLNVIHRDMQTPFFGYRLGVGNAVVGAWLKAYSSSQVRIDGKKKKKWWEKEPKHLTFQGKQRKISRRKGEIYHFLLPDAGMVAAANIKALKEDFETEINHVRQWKKEFLLPLGEEECRIVEKISAQVDILLEEHYQFQQQVNAYVATKPQFFGAYQENEQVDMAMRSYKQKEALAQKREADTAPYAKLKLLMDYWCALWFWDIRHANQLPSRREWWMDLVHILGVDLSEEAGAEPWVNTPPKQAELFSTGQQQVISSYRPPQQTEYTLKKIAQLAPKTGLFDEKKRLPLIQQYAQQHRFFHYQLEFIEVFKERGGFDIAVGNPPWLKLQFEEKDIIGEQYPEVLLRKLSAPKVRQLQAKLFEDATLQDFYWKEYMAFEGAATFLNAYQNYPLLKGQQTNLYKCILENGFQWVNKQGFLGLIHPESVYDDPKGQPLRKEIYQRLKYHFQFKNELVLFAEVHHEVLYGCQIYSGQKGAVDFLSMNNLFHPMTIESSFIHDGHGLAGGYKVKDEQLGKMVWNTQAHADRLIRFTEKELAVLSKTFEDSEDWESAKLVSVHTRQILDVLKKLSFFPSKVKDFESSISEGWHETNSIDKGIIRRETKYPDLSKYELIYSGPHFFVGIPLYKSPRNPCKLNSDYDVIDLTQIPEDYVPRTNYVPDEDLTTYTQRIKGFGEDRPWVEEFKVVSSRRVSIAGERSLQSAIIPPQYAHVHTVISTIFKETSHSVELTGITSSIVLDFFIKTIGRGDYTSGSVKQVPLGIAPEYRVPLFVRTLLLNCLTRPYASLWEEQWQEGFQAEAWSREDVRLKPFGGLQKEWSWDTPLRNYYERRQALVEIDIIVAKALGLSLEELILIYQVQFPVLQQNEDDTWYDAKGNIVFTCSKGLTGVGLDRKEWNGIKDMKAGETYTHIIEKSELYKGEKVVYEAPFDKCDRVEDYKRGWGNF